MREPIPSDLVANALYSSDRTCCVCNQAGRAVQIHHIDGDPSNNKSANLAILCLLCHNETEVRGGFGRHLNAPVVTKFRDEWVARVAARRTQADELAARHSAGLALVPDSERLMEFIRRIPYIRFEALRHAQRRWDAGVTSEMLQATYDYVAVLHNLLLRLARHFPAAQFGGGEPEPYFSSWEAMLFQWHRARLEPHGIGTGGTIVGVMAGGPVITDLEKMVQELVLGLTIESDALDFELWRKRWRQKPKKR